MLALGMSVSSPVWAADPAQPKLIPVDEQTIVAREKSLADSGPEGAKLVAYLDCGSQRESTTDSPVKITWVPSQVYRFESEAKDVLPTQPTIFYAGSRVSFRISGIERAHRYTVGLTWWDYDDGNRTQSVFVASPNGRLVRIAVPAIRLPNYTTDEQLPAERRFSLPVTFARDGQMQLNVQLVTGANAVISELWIWEVKK